MTSAAARQHMRVELTRMANPPIHGMRVPSAEDVVPLGALMFHAYQGTIDSEGETEAQAVEEVQRTLDGAYGPMILACSRVIERDGAFASATLITRWKSEPFVAFSMTHPRNKGQGLARACMIACMNALQEAGEQELRLMVTVANLPAVALYRSLGFTVSAIAR